MSFDGDADRIILFYQDKENTKVIDGDNMIVLICRVVKKIF